MNKETTQCQTESCKEASTEETNMKEPKKEGVHVEEQGLFTAEIPRSITEVDLTHMESTTLPLGGKTEGDPANIPEVTKKEEAEVTEKEPPTKKPRKSSKKKTTPKVKKDSSDSNGNENATENKEDANNNDSDEDNDDSDWHDNGNEKEDPEESKKPKRKIKKYTAGLRRREDVILKDEGVVRRKIMDAAPEAADPQPSTPDAGLRVRLQAQRYVAIKSGPLCRGEGNKKCLFGKGDVVDVLCPDNKSKDGKVMMVVHKSKRDKELMRPRYFADYEQCLTPKGKIECDFTVVKKGRLKLQGMVECYCILVIGKDHLWVDKRLVEELPPGAALVVPPDVLIPVSTNFGAQDRVNSIPMADVRQSVLGRPLLGEEGQKDGSEFGEEDVGEEGGIDKEAMTSLPLFQGPLHGHYGYHRGNGGGGGGGGGNAHQRALEMQRMTQDEEEDEDIIVIDAEEISGIPPIVSPVPMPSPAMSRMNEGDEYLSLPLATQCREQLRSPDPNKK